MVFILSVWRDGCQVVVFILSVWRDGCQVMVFILSVWREGMSGHGVHTICKVGQRWVSQQGVKTRIIIVIDTS